MNSTVLQNDKKPVAVGMGLIALDLVVSADASAPINYWAGGTCGNVLTILSYLGWESFPVARLNNNSASLRVKQDLSQWGVRLDFAEIAPTASTPIIVQEISKNEKGNSTHKFSGTCPKCGASLPNYKPVSVDSVRIITEKLPDPAVFFFDRVSPAAIMLAKRCKALGTVIIFEPSVEGNLIEFKEALNIADIIKYSSDRYANFCDMNAANSSFLEIKTLGKDGLTFRTKANAGSYAWINLPSFPLPEVKDSCGCGDWTTAGFISKLCCNGLKGMQKQSLNDIISALNYGQRLAGWNCGFEGARGGMYRVQTDTFDYEIDNLCSNQVCNTEGGLHNKNKLCSACEG